MGEECWESVCPLRLDHLGIGLGLLIIGFQREHTIIADWIEDEEDEGALCLDSDNEGVESRQRLDMKVVCNCRVVVFGQCPVNPMSGYVFP